MLGQFFDLKQVLLIFFLSCHNLKQTSSWSLAKAKHSNFAFFFSFFFSVILVLFIDCDIIYSGQRLWGMSHSLPSGMVSVFDLFMYLAYSQSHILFRCNWSQKLYCGKLAQLPLLPKLKCFIVAYRCPLAVFIRILSTLYRHLIKFPSVWWMKI